MALIPEFVQLHPARVALFRWLMRLSPKSGSLSQRVRAFARTRLVRPNQFVRRRYFNGCAIWIQPDTAVGRRVMQYGIYEESTTQVIETFVRAGFSMLDVGANIGVHVLAAARIADRAWQRIVAFEPAPNTQTVLRQNLAANHFEFVDVRSVALSDHAGEVTMRFPVADGGQASIMETVSAEAGSVMVPTARLDQLFGADATWAAVPLLIKMDAQGAELVIIRGGAQWLSQQETIALIFEIDPPLLESDPEYLPQMATLLARIGFVHTYKIVEDDYCCVPIVLEDIQVSGGNFNMLCLKGDKAHQVMDKLKVVEPQLPPAETRK